jgi:hypothetical protein
LLGKNGESITERAVSSFDLTVHPDVDKMPIPPRIDSDPEKKALWNFICTDMANRQLLSPTYVLTIAEAVEIAALIKSCRDTMDREGLTQPRYSKTGQLVGMVAHPLAAVLASQQRNLLKIIQMLGMSPRDIHYLVNPDASPNIVIEGQVQELQKIVYFRGDSNG